MQAQVMGQMGQLAKSPMAEELTKQMMQQQSDDGTDQEAISRRRRPQA